jgi:hypothetical protein
MEKPTLYVCDGDTKAPSFHPCAKLQKVMNEKGIEYEKVIAAHGNPIPFLRKDDRGPLKDATGDDKLPALKLADGTVIRPSKKIMEWVKAQA